MCAIISSSYCSFPCPTCGRRERERVFEAWLNERRIFSLPYSDCFPSVLPHWPRCRCWRRRLRWECHKWPETNVGLPHPIDLQHSFKMFFFVFNLSLSPFLPFPSPTLTAFQSLKRSRSCHIPQYPFKSSCFSTSPFPLHLHLSCHIIWQG